MTFGNLMMQLDEGGEPSRIPSSGQEGSKVIAKQEGERVWGV